MAADSSENSLLPPVRKRARGIIRLLTAAVVLFLIVAIVDFYRFREDSIETGRAEVVRLTSNAVNEIDAIARQAEVIAEEYAAELSEHRAAETEASFREHLQKIVQAHPNFYGATVTFAAHEYRPDQEHYSLYYYRNDDRMTFKSLDGLYDYTTEEWFDEALKSGSRWTKAYYDEASSTLLTTYSAVFYDTDPVGVRRPRGVITVDFSINDLRDLLESLDFGPSGYPALTTREGRYLYHPVTDHVTKGKTLLDVAREKNDNTRVVMNEMVQRGESGILEHISTSTGKESWMVFETVPSTGWSLQITFIKDAIDIDAEGMRRRIIAIVVLTILSVIGLMAILLRVEQKDPWRFWVLGKTTSVLLLAGIGIIWFVALQFTELRTAGSRAVISRSTVNSVAREYEELCRKNNLETPLFVPTGIDIQSIRFETPNDLRISGYIWQKYTPGIHDILNRGVVFAGASEVSMEESMRLMIDGLEVVRWRFETLIREDMDYSKYPIDQANIQIRVLHQDLNHNVVLLPDLLSYKFTTPEVLPGVDNEAFLPGWKIDRSFFSLETRVKNTTYGEKESVAKENFPILTFNIGVKRYFVNAFISNLIPIIIVMILLFMLLTIADKIDTGRFMSICVGMFLVVVFSHVDVRNVISAQEIFYLENFYFITYGFILLVCLSAITLTQPDRFRFVKWGNNLGAKLVFWPFITLSLFIITVRAFF